LRQGRGAVGNAVADRAVRPGGAARLFCRRIEGPAQPESDVWRPTDPGLRQHCGEYRLLYLLIQPRWGGQVAAGALQLHLREGGRQMADRGSSLLGHAGAAEIGSRPIRVEQRPPFERIALLLQGGGALGSYQAGVYQALTEADLHPDWIAGISIGAINGALIAGNAPKARVDKLRAFWELVTANSYSDWSEWMW